jgi:hypothetical protein
MREWSAKIIYSILRTQRIGHSNVPDSPNSQPLAALNGAFPTADSVFRRWKQDGVALPLVIPFQLIAEKAVQLVNDRQPETRRMSSNLLTQAMDESVVRGGNAFHHLLRSQSRIPGKWEFLEAFAAKETQPLPEDAAVRRSLRRRELLLEEGNSCRLRVPLMGRWMRKEGVR